MYCILSNYEQFIHINIYLICCIIYCLFTIVIIIYLFIAILKTELNNLLILYIDI